VVVVAKDLTPELVAEGLVREIVHVVQTRRKSLDLEFTERIDLRFATPSVALRSAIEAHLDYVSAETLAATVDFLSGDALAGTVEEFDIDGHPVRIDLSRRSET
ncbi:MAG: DUF5915 domain-containing protein, partial [Planctomycetaceae bacterium]